MYDTRMPGDYLEFSIICYSLRMILGGLDSRTTQHNAFNGLIGFRIIYVDNKCVSGNVLVNSYFTYNVHNGTFQKNTSLLLVVVSRQSNLFNIEVDLLSVQDILHNKHHCIQHSSREIYLSMNGLNKNENLCSLYTLKVV